MNGKVDHAWKPAEHSEDVLNCCYLVSDKLLLSSFTVRELKELYGPSHPLDLTYIELSVTGYAPASINDPAFHYGLDESHIGT